VAADSHNSVHNRIQAVMAHTTRYAFKGQSRLAADVGVSRSTISRLVNGQTNPTFAIVLAVTRALERATHHPMDPRELISPDGTYPTPSACDLVGCRGCTPEDAYNDDNNLKASYIQARRDKEAQQ
jgi:transcriptional regulator with XRE-family HTH domain